MEAKEMQCHACVIIMMLDIASVLDHTNTPIIIIAARG